MGDYVITAVVVGVFGFMFVTIAVFMLSKKNKGQWDEKSRLRGAMRAKGWRMNETVDNLKDFLLGPGVDVDHWPVAQTVGGIMGVTGESGRFAWRSGTTIRPGEGAHIMMSVELPQLPDGSEGDMKEVLVHREADGYWTMSYGTTSIALTPDGMTNKPLPTVLTAQLLAYIAGWEHVENVHLLGDRVTVELGTERSLEDTVQVLEETEAEVGKFIDLLPREAWD